jgi:hypothetical protein
VLTQAQSYIAIAWLNFVEDLKHGDAQVDFSERFGGAVLALVEAAHETKTTPRCTYPSGDGNDPVPDQLFAEGTDTSPRWIVCRQGQPESGEYFLNNIFLAQARTPKDVRKVPKPDTRCPCGYMVGLGKHRQANVRVTLTTHG